MSDLGLGKIITTEQQRDAIHVAVAPVTAGERLMPGERIGLYQGLATSAEQRGVTAIGIVDPFLETFVRPKQRFWLWLFPNTVTGMRHEWQHPAFGGAQAPESARPSQEDSSIAWLTDFAKEFELSYSELMDILVDGSKDDDFYHHLSFQTPSRAYEDREEMWRHYETVTGQRLSGMQKEHVPFSCAC